MNRRELQVDILIGSTVFCVKYRRKVLTDPISERLKELVLKLADVKKYVQNQGQHGNHR